MQPAQNHVLKIINLQTMIWLTFWRQLYAGKTAIACKCLCVCV